MHDLPIRIRFHRTRVGLTQVQVAEALNLTPSAICLWESGSSSPSHRNLGRFAALCGIDLSEFWKGELPEPCCPAHARS